MSADLLSDVAVKILAGLALWLVTTAVKTYLKQRRADQYERIERSARYVRRDLDNLQSALANRDRELEEELRESIRDAGIIAHDVAGLRGMDHLIKTIVKGHDDRADFYETKVDKIWDLIGYENGKFSRRGVWVA